MSAIINIAGKCEIFIATMVASGAPTWAFLGYSIDGVTISERQLEEEVFGDENGGPRGEPLDFQNYGEIHNIELTLTKWDEAVAARLRAGFAGGTQGTVGTRGALVKANLGGFQLGLMPANASFQRAYKFVKFYEPKSMNVGTKHSQLRIPATASSQATGSGSIVWDSNNLPTPV